MTPKEKAFELVTKYSRILPMNQTTLLDRKNCALVAVDEIQKLPNIQYDNNNDESQYDYWTKVKKEIEKI
jgi:hypothetical protein